MSRRGSSQNDRKPETQVSVSVPLASGRCIRAVAVAMSPKARLSVGSSSAPCAVSFSRLPPRSNSGMPSVLSRPFT